MGNIPDTVPMGQVNRGASFRRRFYSMSIDLFIVCLLKQIFVAIYLDFIFDNVAPIFPKNYAQLVDGIHKIHFFILYTILWSYLFFSFYMAEGRSVGALVSGIRAISHPHAPDRFNLQDAFARASGHCICVAAGFIPYLIGVLRKDGRGIPDIMGSGEVILESSYQNSYQDTTVKDGTQELKLVS